VTKGKRNHQRKGTNKINLVFSQSFLHTIFFVGENHTAFPNVVVALRNSAKNAVFFCAAVLARARTKCTCANG
jgi:hypothetical protein